MATTDAQNLPLQKDAYASFDASSMKQMMIRNLTNSGILTDQVYEGSNTSSVINLLAVAYQGLLFYLNRTAAESNFSTAELYENMNRIVKLIGYNPIGYQTSTLSFNASLTESASFDDGVYTIPRFSYFRLNNIPYSFASDASFTIKSGVSNLNELSEQTLLYQGKFIEHPLYAAAGTDNEKIILSLGADTIVDHFTVQVYVKTASNEWSQWTKTESLFLEEYTSKKYELRLNENRMYEIKFGDDNYGKKLAGGDLVQVYYLQSDGTAGEVGANTLDGKPLNIYSAVQYDSVLADVAPNTMFRYITDDTSKYLRFENTTPSTTAREWETVEEIRNNAPSTFKMQNRLITASDFARFIKTNAASFVNDVVVVNNRDYIDGVIKYYYKLGLNYPHTESRILYNHTKYADACDFNNVYAFCLPRATGALTPYNNFLTNAQKQFIVDSVEENKVLSIEVVPSDPVYLEASIEANTQAALDEIDLGNSYIEITKDTNRKVVDSVIKDSVATAIAKAFAETSKTLGATIDMAALNNTLRGIPGVKNINTIRVVDGVTTAVTTGLSFMLLNPVYILADQQNIFSNHTLEYFQAVYLKHSKEDIVNKIVIK